MLALKYRPVTWNELILPAKGKLALQVCSLRKRIESGNPDALCLWLSGPSGCGKTTLAGIIRNALNVTKFDVMEANGKDFTLSDAKAAMERMGKTSLFSNGKGWQILIVNEAHSMSDNAAEYLLDALEHLPARRCVIFTTMRAQTVLFDEVLDKALKTRCIQIEFPAQAQGMADAVAARLLKIAQLEAKDYGADAAKVKRLYTDAGGSIRGALEFIENDGLADSATIEAAAQSWQAQ